MPSSDIGEDEAAPTRPKKATTPRRSPAVRRPANATPTKKAGANKAGTPNSAPARTKPSMKKAEPTLFTDFLLGRPSVNRPRRKSLDVVPMEMKRSAVGKVQPPGGVKERVKQWQKASAAAVVDDRLEPPSEPDDISLHLDDKSVTERDRRRIKFRKNHESRPDRRKSGDKDNPATPLKSVSSPRKRVVSDDHWMVNRERKSSPRVEKAMEEPYSKGQTLPKGFLKNSTNPPLEKKIEDWNKRIVNEEGGHNDKHARTVSKPVPKDVESKLTPSRPESPDPGIPVRSLRERPVLDAGVEKPVCSQDTQKGRQCDAEDYKIPRRRSEKHKESTPVTRELRKSRNPNTVVIDDEEESDGSCRTSTHVPRDKNRQRKSASPESLADIPVGYSAFSVLDISVGGDATGRRPAKPQRQPSLSAVPKVLKKVYTEGMKKVYDAVDPPRIGVNQPPSIESWLKGTSDPFVDDVPTSESIFGIVRPKLRPRSYEKEVSHQRDNTHENEDDGVSIEEPPSGRMQISPSDTDEMASSRQAGESPVDMSLSNKRNFSERAKQPVSPTRLKRSLAARHVLPPKNFRYTPPKDLVVDSYNPQPRSVPNERSPNLSAKGSESSYEIKKTTEGVGCSLKGRDHELDSNTQECFSTRSPRGLDNSYLISKDVPDPSLYKASSQRDGIVTGQRRLSTIASVETLNTSSSLTETSSEISDTTVTQTTVTQNTSRTSSTSNASNTVDKVSDQLRNDLGLKGRLTKHSDLLSVLSLPDTSVRGRTKSIKSARSIRTSRTRLDTATITDLLQELAEDEVKYMRELKTLVDGVIPVLLTCVLSKSDTVAAGLLGQNFRGQTDAFITKPIVDMGVALEQLKCFHKRIPLHDSELLLHWALGAHKVYEDYVDAWRMGFQNVIVNLAPASQSNSAGDQSLDEMPRNEDGDVLNENGERVDVAFLLKRPLGRVKYLAKVLKVCMILKTIRTSAHKETGYPHH